jgi:hypothetical protein
MAQMKTTIEPLMARIPASDRSALEGQPQGRRGPDRSGSSARRGALRDECRAFGLVGGDHHESLAIRAPVRSRGLVPGAMCLRGVRHTAKCLDRFGVRIYDRVPLRGPMSPIPDRRQQVAAWHLRDREVPHGMDPPLPPTPPKGYRGKVSATRQIWRPVRA